MHHFPNYSQLPNERLWNCLSAVKKEKVDSKLLWLTSEAKFLMGKEWAKKKKKKFLLDAWAGKIHFESLSTKQRNYVINCIAFVGKIHTHSKTKDKVQHSIWSRNKHCIISLCLGLQASYIQNELISTCHIKEDVKIWRSKDVFKCYWTKTKLEEEFGSKKGLLEFVLCVYFLVIKILKVSCFLLQNSASSAAY